jgi:hypothetical protein
VSWGLPGDGALPLWTGRAERLSGVDRARLVHLVATRMTTSIWAIATAYPRVNHRIHMTYYYC